MWVSKGGFCISVKSPGFSPPQSPLCSTLPPVAWFSAFPVPGPAPPEARSLILGYLPLPVAMLGGPCCLRLPPPTRGPRPLLATPQLFLPPQSSHCPPPKSCVLSETLPQLLPRAHFSVQNAQPVWTRHPSAPSRCQRPACSAPRRPGGEGKGQREQWVRPEKKRG